MPGPLSHVDPPDAERLDPSAVIETVADVPTRVKPQTWNRRNPPAPGAIDVVHESEPTRGRTVRDAGWSVGQRSSPAGDGRCPLGERKPLCLSRT